MAQLIANSPDIARRYQQRCQTLDRDKAEGKRIKNMGLSKVRYTSVAERLGRAVVYQECMIGVAEELSAVRSGQEPAKVAQNYLAMLDEEILLTGALMAEAADASSHLTRQF